MLRKYRQIYLICVLITFLGCSSERKVHVLDNVKKDHSSFQKDALVGPQHNGSYVLSTSQVVDPAGKTVHFPGRAYDLAMNSKGTILTVKNMLNIVFFNLRTESIMQTLDFPEGGSSFKGIHWGSSDEKVWVTDDKGFLRSAKMNEDSLFIWDDKIILPGIDKDGSYPGGFAIDEKKKMIYVALNRNNTLGVVNMGSGKLEDQIPVGIAPYSVLIKKDKAYVTNWGGRRPNSNDIVGPSSGSSVVINKKNGVASTGTVSVINLANHKVTKNISVHLHPCGMAFSPDSSLLYVANANSDLVSVIDTKSDKVIKSISSKPMEELPFGSAPNSLVVSPDGKTLYIANGGDNLLAVIDLTKNRLKGLIPTEWYPSAVTLSRDGDKLFVLNMKGIGSRQSGLRRGTNAWQGINEYPKRIKKSGLLRERAHNTHDQLASLSFIPMPGPDSLENYTVRAATNMRLPKINQSMNLGKVKKRVVPVPTRPGEKSVFKHVLYIIKENRTYDQIFGDIPKGNGDSTLCMFGQNVTPNHHKLANEFVLIDNLYCNSVLSATGHQWTSQGYVTDYLEKAFPDFVRGYPWNGSDALVYARTGFIWDYVLHARLTFRDYGEFVKADITPKKASWTDLYKDYKTGNHKYKIKATATVRTIQNHICPIYTGSPRRISDQYKAGVFIKELHTFEKADSLPNFMMMSLPNDHTSGTKENFPTPRAMIADNDLALGRIVEAVSKSKFWKDTVIFVVEDDPQFGLDHVDGHRTVAFCISPYTKRHAVISTHYNQNSILRTIELILELPPMSQFDLVAQPMDDCFTNKPDFTPYTALPNNIPLDKMNPKLSSISGKQLYWAKKSMELELNYNDDLDLDEEDMLNRILWHSVQGYDVPYPKKAEE